jgi:sodium-independent sulfate anion transporter 11
MALRRLPDLFVRKVLGIDVNSQHLAVPAADLDKRARETLDSADLYYEEDPSVADWFGELAPSRRDVVEYFISLFPSSSWIKRYNVRWLVGDLVAGVFLPFLAPRCSTRR